MSFYKNFVPHVDKINYDHPVFDKLTEEEPIEDEEYENCQIMADYISRQLLQRNEDNTCEWWHHKDFEVVDEKTGEVRGQLPPLMIERQILVDQKRDKWGLKTKYGTDPYVHYLNITSLLLPETDITPPLADITQLKCVGFTYKRKFLHLIGSKNSGKSSSTARHGVTNAWIYPEKSYTVSATPTLQGAQTTLFGDFTELVEQIGDAHPVDENKYYNRKKPSKDGSALFPLCKINRSSYIDFIDKAMSKGGFIMHRALREGLALGQKGLGKDKREGISFYSIDESNKHDRLEDFETDLNNVQSLPSFFMETSQNPTSQTNAGAQLAKPVVWSFEYDGETYSWGVSKFSEVEKHDMLIYPCSRGGITYRLDGLRSVNIRSGKCIYPYLLKQWEVDEIANDPERGINSDAYRSQIRALFETSEAHNVLLPVNNFLTCRYNDSQYTILKTHDRYLSIDFAHHTEDAKDKTEAKKKRRDPAVILTVRHCLIRVKTGDTYNDIDALVFDRRPELVKFVNNFKWSNLDPDGNINKFYAQYLELNKDKPYATNDLPLGSKIDHEQQIALKAGMIAKEEGIPRNNIIFDCSMRAESTSAIRLILGYAPESFPHKEKPRGFPLKFRDGTTDEISKNANSESMFIGADIAMSGAVRGGANIQEALEEMTKRAIDSKSGQPVAKSEFRRAWGFSPNHADCYSMIAWKVSCDGFQAENPYRNEEGEEDSTYQQAKTMALHTASVMAELE